MRALAAMVSAGLAAITPPAAAAPPARVMSVNLCADQLVLALLPPARITSVSWFSRDAEQSWMAAQARRVPANHGLAEEVVRDRPDLVVTGAYTTPALQALLRRLRYRVLTLEPEADFADIARNIRLVAAAVGERAKGEAMVAAMQARLARLRADRAPPLRVAAWDGAGFSARPGSLYDAILRAAGARNVANDTGRFPSGAPEVEILLATAPQLLLESASASDATGRRSDLAHHPLIRRFWGDRTLVVPPAATVCGTPFSAEAAQRLRDQMRAKLAQARAPLPFQPGGAP
ncbi:MAG: ABC transporter substrate-binding protein [Caulobacteraceae bacterium]|nr:ABC transporter substrate-binding protein [Caulobacter sp.]